MDTDSLVSLTANIMAGEYEKSKTLIFDVIRNVTDKEDCVRLDAERIDYPYISIHENGSKEIVRSFQLIDSGVYGSDIVWSSSIEIYLTNSGRVIRPRYNEEDAAVALTSTISKDGYSITKDFNFTVLADQKFIDPMFMRDEEFFGVWNGDNLTMEGKWNYSRAGDMIQMEFAVDSLGLWML